MLATLISRNDINCNAIFLSPPFPMHLVRFTNLTEGFRYFYSRYESLINNKALAVYHLRIPIPSYISLNCGFKLKLLPASWRNNALSGTFIIGLLLYLIYSFSLMINPNLIMDKSNKQVCYIYSLDLYFTFPSGAKGGICSTSFNFILYNSKANVKEEVPVVTSKLCVSFHG